MFKLCQKRNDTVPCSGRGIKITTEITVNQNCEAMNCHVPKLILFVFDEYQSV